MDLELLFDEGQHMSTRTSGTVEPFGGQLRVEADMDTSPERRQRSKSRRITFPREDELETVAVIMPRSQRARGQPGDMQEIVEALLYARRDTGRFAARSGAGPARCLQLLSAHDGQAVPTSSPDVIPNSSGDQVAPVTPRRRKSSVFEMDEPVPASAPQQPCAPHKSSVDTSAVAEARVLQLWGCGPSSGAQLSLRTTPVLPSSEEAQEWVHQAWGWSLPGHQKQPQESSQAKDKLEEGTEAPLFGLSEQQRAKVLSDWGCVPSAEEGIPPPSRSAGHCDAGREQQWQWQRSSCVQSWNAVTDQIVASYLAH